MRARGWQTRGLGIPARVSLRSRVRASAGADLDAPRVNAFVEALRQKYYVFKHLSPDSTCSRSMELLIKNFYRHPGTALYKTMVSGFDSYYRMAFKKGTRPPIWSTQFF